MAKRIALRYASRNSRHPDEAVAEAWFQLCVLFIGKKHLYDNAPNKDQLVGIFVKRNVMKYFEKRGSRENRVLEEKIVQNTDEEMVEWLSGILPDEDAFKVFNMVRNGVDLFDIEMVDPLLRKIAKRLRLQVAGRIKRIEQLQQVGIKTTREIKYVGQVEAEPEDNQESHSDPGESEGRSHPTTAA